MQSSLAQTNDTTGVALDTVALNKLAEAVRGLTPQQLHWASGYLAGIGQQAVNDVPSNQPQATILYASHTGNGKGIAEQLSENAVGQGIANRVLSISDYNPKELTKESLVILVVSTHGEGEPPESALEFHRYLFSRNTNLQHLCFAVFGLGDSSYEHFCAAGKAFDQRFQELGAKPLLARIDADLEFQPAARAWQDKVIEKAADIIQQSPSNVVALAPIARQQRHDRSHPYLVRVIDRRPLTTESAVSEVYHVALEVDPQVLSYQAGDALGILPENDPQLVIEILKATGIPADQQVIVDEQEITIEQALHEKRELTLLHPSVVSKWLDGYASEHWNELKNESHRIREFASSHQFIDLLDRKHRNIDAQDLVDLLQAIQPRLYSIASSPEVYDDEVHLAVSALRYETNHQVRLGTASNFLGKRLQAGSELSVYIAENERFRLPEDPNTDIILIAAGTGIAPFRSFLQQREAQQASGQNWLFFGNRNFRDDFIYQQEWVRLRDNGILTKASLAFSRDDGRRAYVQDRILEQGEALFQWIENGAAVYVCGAIQMEKGVMESLVDVFQNHGGLDQTEAQAYFDNLRASGRYLRDVY
jgi:sulfite reductase (NADPH) flavoprotein alpha-component